MLGAGQFGGGGGRGLEAGELCKHGVFDQADGGDVFLGGRVGLGRGAVDIARPGRRRRKARVVEGAEVIGQALLFAELGEQTARTSCRRAGRWPPAGPGNRDRTPARRGSRPRRSPGPGPADRRGAAAGPESAAAAGRRRERRRGPCAGNRPGQSVISLQGGIRRDVADDDEDQVLRDIIAGVVAQQVGRASGG